MAESLKVGDKVQSQSPQGPVQGAIKKPLTAPCDIQGHHVAASPDDRNSW